MAIPTTYRDEDIEGFAPPSRSDEAHLEERARLESLHGSAPGTVGTRVVIRECGNVRVRPRVGMARD
ncbi:MAG: hypothetical protein AB7I38_00100 [Dehalococcoidia bacterium]